MAERPKRHDTAVLALAASKVADILLKNWSGLENDDRDGIERDLARALRGNRDGYEIAKELDSMGWEVDADLVSLLDGWSVEDACNELTRAWVETSGITPKLAVGAAVRVTLAWGGGPFDGTIIRVDAKHARYDVNVPAKGHSPTTGYVLNCEDVERANPDALGMGKSDPAVFTQG